MAVCNAGDGSLTPFIAKYCTTLGFDMDMARTMSGQELICAMSEKLNEIVAITNDVVAAVNAMEAEWENVKDTFAPDIQEAVNEYFASSEFTQQLTSLVDSAVADQNLTGRVGELEDNMDTVLARGVWLSQYGANQSGLQSAVNAASYQNPLIIDVPVTMTEPITISKDIRVIGLAPLTLTPYQASAQTTARYYFDISGADRVEFDGVSAVSQASYTPGINILNGDNTGAASNVFLAQVVNVGESVFRNCSVEYCSLVRQGTGTHSVDNALYVYGCRGCMVENFVNVVNGSCHIYDCDIECSSNTRTASGYSEYYHGIYIGAVFFDSEVIGCNFTIGGNYFVSSALHFNDSSGNDHDVNIECRGNTVVGYQSGGSFNYGTVLVDGMSMPEGAMGGANGSVLTVNTDLTIRNVVALPAASQYRFLQINSDVNVRVDCCRVEGISTAFTTTNSTDGAIVTMMDSHLTSYQANTGSVTTMPLTLKCYGCVLENFQNYTTTQAVVIVYSNCTLIPHASSGQLYLNLAAGSSLLLTGTVEDSGSIALQGDGTKNVDCVQLLYNGLFSKYTTIE